MTESHLNPSANSRGPMEWIAASSHQLRLQRHARRMMPNANSDSVLDCVQDAHLCSLKSLDGFRGKGKESFASWTCGILSNVVASIQRGFARRQRIAKTVNQAKGAQLSSVPDGTCLTPSHLASREEQRDCLRTAIASLPPQYQEIVRLRYEERCTCSEIAIALGIKEKDVYNRLYRAVTLLGRRLSEKEENA